MRRCDAGIPDAGIAALDRDETNYTPNEGIAPLRQAFAARFGVRMGSSVDPSRVYVTAGAQQGLHLAMSMLLDTDDEVLIPNPGYPTFAMTAQLIHARPVDYPLRSESGFQPRISDLEDLVTARTRVLVLNSPSNPLGTSSARPSRRSSLLSPNAMISGFFPMSATRPSLTTCLIRAPLASMRTPSASTLRSLSQRPSA